MYRFTVAPTTLNCEDVLPKLVIDLRLRFRFPEGDALRTRSENMIPIKISGVELNWIDRENIKLDRLTLGDLGLKMPRLTKKYWLGVRQLSISQQTSPFFFHQMAAQSGSQAVYKYLEELGFTWNDNNWVKTT